MKRFLAYRIAVLTVALVLVAAWAYSVKQRRAARTEWQWALSAAVVLTSQTEVSEDVLKAWQDGIARLEDWFMSEQTRFRPEGSSVFQLRLFGPILSSEPPFEPISDRWIDRALHAWQLHRALSGINEQAQLVERKFDVRIYVTLRSSLPHVGFAEGVGEAGGEVGLVHASINDADVTLPLTAIAHELLHCLGASDKYDGSGHAEIPVGLVEPNLEPLFPQNFAEVMVGEIPIDLANGRLPNSLNEVRVGPATAAEIRWTVSDEPQIP